MAQLIASTLIRYNANSRGTITGDCVCRAISFAYQKPYDEVRKDLNAEARSLHTDNWKIRQVWGRVVAKYGYVSEGPVNPPITVNEFCENNPNGIYLLLVGDKPDDRRTSHMVCVSDDRVYDSWDSRKWYVKSYYAVEGSIELSDISDHIGQLEILAQNIIRQQVDIQAKKYGMKLKHEFVGNPLFRNKYSIDVDFGFEVEEDFKTYEKSYNLKIVFTPTMSYEEAKAKVEKLTKIRVYDRMYELHKAIESEREGYELVKQGSGAGSTFDMRWMSNQEKRFYNSLPGWVKPFITYLSVQSPGQYWSSYELRFKPLPGDPNQSNVSLDAYDSQEMKVRLEEYKKNYERSYPYFDYY